MTPFRHKDLLVLTILCYGIIPLPDVHFIGTKDVGLDVHRTLVPHFPGLPFPVDYGMLALKEISSGRSLYRGRCIGRSSDT